jgi:hypothetical protein
MSSASAIGQETKGILSTLVGQPFLGNLVIFFGENEIHFTDINDLSVKIAGKFACGLG